MLYRRPPPLVELLTVFDTIATLICYLLIGLFGLGIIVFVGGTLVVVIDWLLMPFICLARFIRSRAQPPTP